MFNNHIIEIHKNPKQFLSAIHFTAAETGFQPTLIEKDYYCSLVLNYLSQSTPASLVFKGGTLLAKAHAGFYRLSEDLDFTISTEKIANRKLRSNAAKFMKPIINTINDHLPEFKIEKPLQGMNESRQYNAELHYQSLIDDQIGRILIEISLREALLLPTVNAQLQTILMNPFNSTQMVLPIHFQAMDKEEAYAEKIRAALTRNRMAIRDFYDIHHALKNNIIHLDDEKLIKNVKQKITVSGENIIEFCESTYNELDRKINTELLPTLREHDLHSFDLTNVLKELCEFSKKLINQT